MAYVELTNELGLIVRSGLVRLAELTDYIAGISVLMQPGFTLSIREA